jgi:hypothetical protein
MILLSAMLAVAAAGPNSEPTDFGLRAAPGERVWRYDNPRDRAPRVHLRSANINSAVQVVAQWGRVSSTRRSPSHNRNVGGSPTSFHLVGRAIDVVRRPGVRHSEIEAALIRSGFRLIESLDEGDHSHFAF